MSNFRCNFIEYIPTYLVESITNNSIVPKTGETVRELLLSSAQDADEVQKTQAGNNYFEQTIKCIAKYTNVSEISELIQNRLILQLTDVDGNKIVWGTIIPDNPVRASIKASKQFADITFYRNSENPEF